MKILMADDDSVSRTVLRATLRALGHQVLEAADGSEAWSILEEQEVPLVISDWLMPKVDGLELCRRIRRRRHSKYVYVIILTAAGGKDAYLEGMKAGADDFITKPFDGDQLAARIRVAERVLNLQSQIKQLAGLLPICSYCKKVRDDQDYWQQLEVFLCDHTDAQFSHGICPGCYETIVKPELARVRGEAPPAPG